MLLNVGVVFSTGKGLFYRPVKGFTLLIMERKMAIRASLFSESIQK